MNFLGVEILREIGLSPPPFWRALEAISDRFPVISSYIRDRNGRQLPWEDDRDDTAIRSLEMLQYDLLFAAICTKGNYDVFALAGGERFSAVSVIAFGSSNMIISTRKASAGPLVWTILPEPAVLS
jgi:hypothetical protein